MTTMTTGEALRACADCGLQAWTEADLEGFKKGSGYKHGRQSLCKPCASAQSRGWKAENADRVRKYRETNRDRIAEYNRQYKRQYYSGAFRDRLVWDVRELSYQRIHQRLNAHFGKASDYDCVHCSGPAREWAYTNDDEDCRYGVNGNGYTVAYSLKPEYYQPLCIDCHRAFDADHRDSRKAA